MSKETSTWLNNYCKIGFTDKRGMAWHYRKSDQGSKPNHYAGAIPVEDVLNDLFNWEAQEAEVSVQVNGEWIKQPDRKAIVRSDNGEVLGMFKAGYAIHQYEEWLINSLSNVIDDDLNIGSAGLLKRGAVAFVSIEMPESIKVLENFTVRPMLLATTSHNGSIGTTFKKVSTRVECDNLLAYALQEGGESYRARHSKNSTLKLQSVRDALGFVHAMTEDIVAEVLKYASVKVSDREWEAIVQRLIPFSLSTSTTKQSVSRVENKQERIRDMYKNDPRVAPFKGTALGVLQAFNTNSQHNVGKAENKVERNMFNAITGKVEAYDLEVLSAIKELVMV